MKKGKYGGNLTEGLSTKMSFKANVAAKPNSVNGRPEKRPLVDCGNGLKLKGRT